MPLIEFVGQSVQDSGNVQSNTARLINCYRELVPSQGRTQYVLQSVLGQAYKSDIGAFPVRGMGRGNQKSWMVANGTLYELADAGTTTSRGSVADSALTTIDGNYTDVTIVAGGNYYVWDGATISQPTTKTFTTVGSHCYVGGYTVITEDSGKRFQWTTQGDATALDALHFASAEKVDDNILRAVEIQGNLVLFCERSTEVWQVTTQAGAEAFAHVGVWNRGLKSFGLLTAFDDSVLFVGDDNNVYLGSGPAAIDVTPPGLNTALENNDATHCFYYEDRGHKFCVVRFSDRPAWVFDVKMREWHERAEGAGNEAWRATHSVYGASWLVGNDDGEVLELDRTNQDLNGLLRRTAISRTAYLGDKFRVNKLEVMGRVGDHSLTNAVDYGADAGEGFILDAGGGFGLEIDSVPSGPRDANIELCESGDAGNTWGTAKVRSMGRNGDYTQRMTWRARGQYQQYTAKIVVSEPADIPINTTANVEVI